jgi:hypothetical protein
MSSLRAILYTRTFEKADTLVSAFRKKWDQDAPEFMDYLNKNYLDSEADKRRWMFCYRENVPHAWMHTNNFIESWHNALKKHFFRDKQQRRIDTVIYILVHRAIPHYQTTWVHADAKVGRMTPGQKQALEQRIHAVNHRDQELTKDPDVVLLKEPEQDQTVLQVRSFTNSLVFYDVNVDWSARSGLGLFKSCSCLAFVTNKSCCKHLALALIEFPGTKFVYSGHRWETERMEIDSIGHQEDPELDTLSPSVKFTSLDEARYLTDRLANTLESADRGHGLLNATEVLSLLQKAMDLVEANTKLAPEEELTRKRRRQRKSYSSKKD